MVNVDSKIIRVLKGFKAKTARKYGIEKMILFGSQAEGTARPNSNIDLIIVTARADKDIIEKLIDEWHIKQEIDYPVDFVDYTAKEFEGLAKRPSLVSKAMARGIEI
jgi:predicted nucleotidyltransferase